MLGHSLASFLINLLVLVGAGSIIQLISYLITKPVIDFSGIVTLFGLVALTMIPYIGYYLAVGVSFYILFRMHKLYKIGAITFLVVFLISFWINHSIVLIHI